MDILVGILGKILLKYQPLLANMYMDGTNNQVPKVHCYKPKTFYKFYGFVCLFFFKFPNVQIWCLQANLILLMNPYCLLGMWCLILLLENIDFLVQFALQHDVFICDLVFVIKICQGSFIHYTMMAIHHFPMMNYEHLKFSGF